MTMPGFTAEASTGKIRENYVLTPAVGAKAGRVLPAYWDIYPCYTRADGGVGYCCCAWYPPGRGIA